MIQQLPKSWWWNKLIRVVFTVALFLFGKISNAQVTLTDVIIPSGTFDMGDHFGFVDPNHPSDETPIHSVELDSFYISNIEISNAEYLLFLNDGISSGQLTVVNHCVYLLGDTNILCYTYEYEPWYSISYNGTSFLMADFRANHPMNGVMWYGAALYCNWRSNNTGLQSCYNTLTWTCDFSKNGYRLPSEAEWEYAARGGSNNPYFNYPNGDSIITSAANLPSSGDPYEVGLFPFTTPVGFYDGTLKHKSTYNWPSSDTSYQTSNGINGYGLYDIQGNVWEMVNDWYTQNYYSISPLSNPTGPSSGFLMPDGKPYHGMRGGNWYNGNSSSGTNDGHSRVSNRNPCYFRGPQDPNHPWYHIGFRIARNYIPSSTGQVELNDPFHLNIFPNPASNFAMLSFQLDHTSHVEITAISILGKPIEKILSKQFAEGLQTIKWFIPNKLNGSVLIEIKSNGLVHSKILVITK